MLRKLVLVPIALLLASGVLASYRAYFPVRDVTLLLPESALRAGSPVRAVTRSSGRGPVEVRIELVQGARSELIAVQRLRGRRFAFWDPRAVETTLTSAVSRELIERFEPGPAVLRATATGSRAWLRQPPPVVRDVAVEIRRE